ncbi:MAG TPA: hypothetical protein VKU38_11065 [Ktedonobacteraceae bacterium]|nr:hypothetical protein [Ktedonobacteraceae bacterium]
MALFPAPHDAALLAALDVHPGQRVLEIGMGSADTTARIASLIGDNGLVVSLALHEEMAYLTCRSLEERGVQNVSAYRMDGVSGYPAQAPYDRIIAYGSVCKVPLTWLEQLAPGGVLVGNLSGNLASVFLRLIKGKGQTSGRGIFLPLEGHFPVALDHVTTLTSPSSPEEVLAHMPVQEYVATLDVPSLLKNEAFLFFLQCEMPQLRRYWRDSGASDARNILLFDPVLNASFSSETRDDTCIVRVSGDPALWEQIERCYYRWQQARCGCCRCDILSFAILYLGSICLMTWYNSLFCGTGRGLRAAGCAIALRARRDCI